MIRHLTVRILMLLIILLMIGTIAFAQAGENISRLIIAHDANYPPFSFIDESGSPKGYLIDIWRAFGKANSVEIKFKLGTWQESLDMVKNGEADVHGGLFFSVERDRFLDYGPTVTDLSTHLYILKEATTDEATKGIVGVVRGGYEEYYMRNNRPDRPLLLFDQNQTMIEAASKSSIKAFVADQPTGTYYMHIYGIGDLVKDAETLYTKAMRVAVGNGKHGMLEFISYGWMKMDKTELKYIHGKWFLAKEPNPDWLLSGIGIAVLALIIAFIIRKIGRRAHGLD